MHVLFLAPDTHVYNHDFIRGLKEVGARVSALGYVPLGNVSQPLHPLLDFYEPMGNPFDEESMLEVARRIDRKNKIDRIETIDEPMVIPAAKLRESMGLSGTTVRTATLCRDKTEMKSFLRDNGIPCAESRAASRIDEVREFAEKVGFPIILKPRAGFGSLGTEKIHSNEELDRWFEIHQFGNGSSIAAEEFVEGQEGFYDTLAVDGKIHYDFVSFYFPGCLAALQDRRVSPQIAVTNRVEADGYDQLRELGQKVNDLLGIESSATHMEWFFGKNGIKFSEIGARPAGEQIWDLYRVANDLDVYRDWAAAITGKGVTARPSREFAAGSIQVRPDRDGHFIGHEGLAALHSKYGQYIYQSSIPSPGEPALPLEKGWLCNTWFRLRHPDQDKVREMMDFISKTVVAHAR